MQLRAECARVLGSLIEKALTTPQQYPLTLVALVSACNQASNREPVVDYDEHTVKSALDELKELRLVRYVLPSHGRSVVRYRQVLDEALGLDAAQSALLGVMLLRGPQTIGELRIRTERMTQFDTLEEVTKELERLSGLGEPLAVNVGRRPGQKEERWATPLLSPEPGVSPLVGATSFDDDGWLQSDQGGDPATGGAPRQSLSERVEEMGAELADLSTEVAELRRALHELRSSLGD
jgi:uncharacterized protein YceH (UPF0502 family)